MLWFLRLPFLCFWIELLIRRLGLSKHETQVNQGIVIAYNIFFKLCKLCSCLLLVIVLWVFENMGGYGFAV